MFAIKWFGDEVWELSMQSTMLAAVKESLCVDATDGLEFYLVAPYQHDRVQIDDAITFGVTSNGSILDPFPILDNVKQEELRIGIIIGETISLAKGETSHQSRSDETH